MFAFLHTIFIWSWWRKYRWRTSVSELALNFKGETITVRAMIVPSKAISDYRQQGTIVIRTWLITKKINVFFGRKYFFGVLFNRCLIENWGNHILPGSIQRKENWMKDRKVPNGRGKSSCSGYWNVQICRRSRWRSSWATGKKDAFYLT